MRTFVEPAVAIDRRAEDHARSQQQDNMQQLDRRLPCTREGIDLRYAQFTSELTGVRFKQLGSNSFPNLAQRGKSREPNG